MPGNDKDLGLKEGCILLSQKSSSLVEFVSLCHLDRAHSFVSRAKGRVL